MANSLSIFIICFLYSFSLSLSVALFGSFTRSLSLFLESFNQILFLSSRLSLSFVDCFLSCLGRHGYLFHFGFCRLDLILGSICIFKLLLTRRSSPPSPPRAQHRHYSNFDNCSIIILLVSENPLRIVVNVIESQLIPFHLTNPTVSVNH